MKGKVKEQWGKLTDDDLTAISGRRDQLEGKIQERYGYAKDQVRKEIDDWYRSTALAANGDTDLADQIEAIRTDIQSLTSTVGRIANKQLGRAQDKAVEAANDAEEAIRARGRGSHGPSTSVSRVLGPGGFAARRTET
jgi:uncharacterized protein YjbJ (UPF0337 family)